MIDQFTGPLQCVPFSWTAQEQKEPFYYKDNSNITLDTVTPIWVRYSPDFYLDFSDSRILSVKAASDSSLSGILVMMKPGETITISGGTSAGMAVSFVLPNGSIVFSNTEGYYCHSPTPFRNASVQKTITETGTSNSIVLPIGTDTNNQHGDYRLFSFATYGTGDAVVPTTSASNFTLRGLTTGVLKTVLSSKSFITTNNIFRCKFAHIITGVSHCYIRNMTCDADC